MEEMYAGDPAVLPVNIVTSMPHGPVTPPIDNSQPTEEDTSNEQPSTSTPCVGRKRRRSRMDCDEPPEWFERYRQMQQEMHNEKMVLETRRVTALESLVNLLKEKE